MQPLKTKGLKMSNTKCLVVLSGGQDSTTCLYWARQAFDEVYAITFDYGQRHSRELEAARKIAEMAECKLHRILKITGYESIFDHGELVKSDVGRVLEGTSPLVSDNELEQYANHSVLPGGLEKTFVPMRNQFFLTVAANYAYTLGIRDLVTGVCQEDFGGYPDCRQVFIDALQKACNLGTFTGKDGALGPLIIHTPLMNLTKAQTVTTCCHNEDCYEALAYSHTSYDGAYPPTGHDHATLLRQKGFEEAGIPDPLVLRAWCEGLMDLPKTDNYSDKQNLQHWCSVAKLEMPVLSVED